MESGHSDLHTLHFYTMGLSSNHYYCITRNIRNLIQAIIDTEIMTSFNQGVKGHFYQNNEMLHVMRMTYSNLSP